MDERLVSIREMFENRIVLRDLHPTDTSLPDIDTLRDDLRIPPRALPRKNEKDYARVVNSIVHSLTNGAVRHLFYVGDTAFHDGWAIRNLGSLGTMQALGFICNEKSDPAKRMGNYRLGNIIFGDFWSDIWMLLIKGREVGFRLDHTTVGVFDLDQTVYAAKGRNHEALRSARLAAVHETLRHALGPHRYQSDRVTRLYRAFDTERFHPITGDNQDYITFLVMICSIGLQDPEGVIAEFRKDGASMLSFIAGIRSQIELLRRDEHLDEMWDLVQEMYYNSLNGDTTPLKAFRAREFEATAAAMETDRTDLRSAIVITAEVLDLVTYLKSRGCSVIAFSDRPREAAYPADNSTTLSLLDIPMHVAGASVRDRLAQI